MSAESGYLTFPIKTQDLIAILVQNGYSPTDAREAAVQWLNNAIIEGYIEFPFRRFFLEAPQVLMAHLKAYVPHPVVDDKYYLVGYNSKLERKLYSPFLFRGHPTYILSTNAEYQNIDDLSDIFIEDIRLKTHRPNENSVMDYWVNDDLRQEFLRKVLYGNPPTSRWKLKPSEVLDYASLRNVLYYMTFESKQFRPTWAKSLLALVGIYGPPLTPGGPGRLPELPPPRILDMSAGWGDRLLTAMAIDADYLGFDPDTELQNGHSEMIAMFGNPERHRVIYKPFEEATAEEIGTGYDVMLTSPPYFETELYPGDNQSTDKFPEYVAWMNGFLFPSLIKSWNALKMGGYLMLHLSDPSYPQGERRAGEARDTLYLAEPTNLFIEDYLPGSSYQGVIGVCSEKGADDNKEDGGVTNDLGAVAGSQREAIKKGPVRPVWVWQKLESGSRDILRWNPRVHRSLAGLYPNIVRGVTFPYKPRR